MKVIDFKKKGNLVRLYLGKDDLEDWYGDDWDDAPYEHNAGQVYFEFVTGYLDFAIPMNVGVYEPGDSYEDSPWTKDDMKNGKCPMLLIEPKKGTFIWSGEYINNLGDKDAIRIYMGDSVEDVKKTLQDVVFGGIFDETDDVEEEEC